MYSKNEEIYSMHNVTAHAYLHWWFHLSFPFDCERRYKRMLVQWDDAAAWMNVRQMSRNLSRELVRHRSHPDTSRHAMGSWTPWPTSQHQQI